MTVAEIVPAAVLTAAAAETSEAETSAAETSAAEISVAETSAVESSAVETSAVESLAAGRTEAAEEVQTEDDEKEAVEAGQTGGAEQAEQAESTATASEEAAAEETTAAEEIPAAEEGPSVTEEPAAENEAVTEEDALQEKEAEKADTADTDNHFNAYIEGFDLDIYTYLAWMELRPGQEQVVRVKAEADDCSKLTYTWICDGEVVREVTAAELKAQGLPETTDELRIVGEKECRYQVRVSDGYSENPIVRYLDVELDNDFTVYPYGAHINASGFADESRTIYAAYGETITLKTCASAYDAERITYEWYDKDGYTSLGEHGDSVQVTVTNACTYRCRVKDGYGSSKNVYFYIKMAEDFKAWPEGAAIDEYGKRAKEVTISTTPGERLTLRVITEGADEEELFYAWGRQRMKAGGAEEEGGSEEEDVFDTTEHRGGSAEISPFVTTYYYCSVEDDYGTLIDLTFRVIVNGFTAYPEGAEPDRYDANGRESVALFKVYPGEELTLRPVVNQSGDSPLHYKWESSDWDTWEMTELTCTDPVLKIRAATKEDKDIDGNPVRKVKSMTYYCTVSDETQSLLKTLLPSSI